MAVIEDVIQNLMDIGFYDIVLPWLLTFAIVFGILSKLSLFGDKIKNKLNTILAAIIAFFVVNFVPVKSYTEMFTQLFGEAALVLAGMLLVFIILGMIMIKRDDLATLYRKDVFVIIIIIGAGALVLRALGPSFAIPVLSDISIDGQTLITTVIIIAILFILYSMVKEGGGEKSGGGKDYSKLNDQQLIELAKKGDLQAAKILKDKGYQVE